jgi:2-polyprenyl-6-methoxyphenol hydroxylase-like FAD-dependent oxidoreductase
MDKPRALVIGGSLGGLLAANLMRSIGWEALVFERNAEDLTSRGAGLGTHAHLLDVLARIGIPFDESMGVKVDSVICLDRSGNIVAQRPTVRTMTAWARLYRSLRTALPQENYRLGMALDRVEQREGVIAIFADGTRVAGDLLIAADGIRSTVRDQFLPQAQPQYAGYVAWRAMLEESEIPRAIRSMIFERYAFCLPEGEQLLGYPVPGRNDDTQIGRRAYNIVWYRPISLAGLDALCTDASGRRHGTAIPPPMIRREVIADVKAACRALIAPALAEIFVRTPRPFFQPIFDLESHSIVFGRVALLGDAAFVARPHVGAGVTKAAIEAASLADAVAAGSNLEAALASYQRRQQPFGSRVVALARAEGTYLSAQSKPREARTPAELHRDIDDVIRSHASRADEVRSLIAGRPAPALPAQQ